MSCEPDTVSEAELHAYVDGWLDPARLSAVQAYLAAHPEEAQRLQDYQVINQGLHELFDGVLNEPLPDRLIRRPAARRPWRPLLKVAAVAGWLALGGVMGWLVHGYFQERTTVNTALVRQAMIAHAVYVPEVRHPVEVEASQEQHLTTWLTKRLGTDIRIPSLGEFGYQLLGGRLLPAESGPAAQFMYQDAGGHRLTLFLRRNTEHGGDTAFRFAQTDGIRGFYWIDRDLGYALIGDMDKETLAGVAHAVYRELNVAGQ
jgi:anti-sigma factor RsiW